MTTSSYIFETSTLWTASLWTLGFRLGSRWKTAQCWFVFSLSPCFLSIYLEMSSSSFRPHLHWVLVELFLTLILAFLSKISVTDPSLCDWIILSLYTEGWCSILTNFLFFSHTLSCQWPLLSPDFNYHSYVIKYHTSTALSHAFPGAQWPMCHVGTHWTSPMDAPQIPPHHHIQWWAKLLPPQSHENEWGHSREPIFLCSVILSARISSLLSPLTSLILALLPISLLRKEIMFSFSATIPESSLTSTLCLVTGWRIFIIDASGLTLLICSIIYKTANLSTSELLNKYQRELDLVPDKHGSVVCGLGKAAMGERIRQLPLLLKLVWSFSLA